MTCFVGLDVSQEIACFQSKCINRPDVNVRCLKSPAPFWLSICLEESAVRSGMNIKSRRWKRKRLDRGDQIFCNARGHPEVGD
jgi:hypothetical protein